jgi:SAM-dependent methyltransferase
VKFKDTLSAGHYSGHWEAKIQFDHFSGKTAKDYDEGVAFNFAPEILEPTIRRLAELANGGDCLEFAIGTGRVALPLHARGLRVDGIEFSPDMIAELRKKPGGNTLDVRQGDMTTTEMNRTYALVFLVFNTIMNLTTQAAQVQCFRIASKHLGKGGKFVVEVMVPALRLYPPGAIAVPFNVSSGHLGFDTYETAEQKLTSHHVTIAPDGTSHYSSIPFRYVWPSELDLMAELAGMKLLTRHADWIKTPFDDTSRQHVSVWEKI